MNDLSTELRGHAQSCVACFPAVLSVCPGQCHPHVLLAKAMLRALANSFPELMRTDVSDQLDEITSENLRHIQHCAGLPETGCLDKPTWNSLCRLYRAIFDRYHAPTQG